MDPSWQSPHKLPVSVQARSPKHHCGPRLLGQAWHCKPMNEKSRNSDPRPSGPPGSQNCRFRAPSDSGPLAILTLILVRVPASSAVGAADSVWS